MNKPRIYIAIATFHPLVGGAEKQALLQAQSLRERGYDATIITFRHDKDWPCYEAIAHVPIIRVGGILLGQRERFPRFLQKGLYLLAMLVMGYSLWRQRHRYDILHVYQLTLLALPAAIACRLTGKPLIISVRCAASGGRSTISGNKAALRAGPLDPALPWLEVSGQPWGEGDVDSLERQGKLFVYLTHTALLRVRPMVTLLSTRTADYLAEHHFALPQTQLIPNGVDTTRFCVQERARNAERPQKIAICVAQLRYQKGIDVLLQAWRLVQAALSHPNPPHLLIVGSGPLREQLVRLATALGIERSVTFAGEQSDIPALLQSSDVAILPSRWEGMPNALLEAMACGLPCIATRVSGSEDIIQHGVNGLLVEAEDEQAMAQAILTLFTNEALAQTYGDNGRKTIEQRYALAHITEMYLKLYHELVENSPPHQADRKGSALHRADHGGGGFV